MAVEYDSPLVLHAPMRTATRAAKGMRAVETIADAEIAEAHRSAETFAEVEEVTAPLDRFLSLIHAFDWFDIRNKHDKMAMQVFFGGQLGNPIDNALGRVDISTERAEGALLGELLQEAWRLIDEECFLNWQAALLGVCVLHSTLCSTRMPSYLSRLSPRGRTL